MHHQQKIQCSKFQAIPRTTFRLRDRKAAKPSAVRCAGLEIMVNRGVYQTSGDSELMIESVKLKKNEDFLEIGCGSGIICLALAKYARKGIGVDINQLAVENSRQNAELLNLNNIEFIESNVFERIQGQFDVIIFNPPYLNHKVEDDIDRMFWDPEDNTKKTFFKQAGSHLKPRGRIYFGWADCADIDIDLPFRLAKKYGYKLVNSFSKLHPRGEFTFYVLEFKRC